jgi:dynactin complex subunit
MIALTPMTHHDPISLKPYIAKQININYMTHAYTHVHLSIIPKYMFLQYPLSHKKIKKIDNNYQKCLNLESFHFQFHHYVTPSRRIMFYFKTSDDCTML